MARRRRPGVHSSAWIRPEKRHAIYARDGWICVWCGQRPDDDRFTLDHLFPRAHPCRDNDSRRLVTACLTCNLSRKDTPVSDWLRSIRAAGHDVEAVLRRLAVARYVPIHRAAGVRALSRWRQPPPQSPAESTDWWMTDGAPR